MATSTSTTRILIYLLRRDLRLSDNPVFHEIQKVFNSTSEPAPFTHLLPIYVFPAHQVEISGFLSGTEKSPYPEARSRVAGFWRCGHHRAKFLAESVWDLKESVKAAGSDLTIRAGMLPNVIRDAIGHIEKQSGGSDVEVCGVWMTSDEGSEEKDEEEQIRNLVEGLGKQFRLFTDAKFYIDDRDLPFDDIKKLPNIYTEYRKSVEPLRSRPRRPLPKPRTLPPLPDSSLLPPQAKPFTIPDSREGLVNAILQPLDASYGLSDPPRFTDDSPEGRPNAHPFHGGETEAWSRVDYLLSSGAMTAYKDTRNGLLGVDFSTKLSSYLALGCISARQVHAMMLEFEDGFGTSSDGDNSSDIAEEDLAERKERLNRWKDSTGFGQGENKGMASVRFELLWRDYFRLYARKFGSQIFLLDGIKTDTQQAKSWGRDGPSFPDFQHTFDRFRSGRTGIGLIDASQRELFLTGYTSNRARLNVASFLAKHLCIDWRLGAEWYECMLVDYDVANNWGNWQYVSGVGNDPRADRQFNPIKQAFDYDPRGEYIRAWIPELRNVRVESESADASGGGNGLLDQELLIGVFQASRLPQEEKERLGLKGVEWVERPLKSIEFTLGRRPRPPNSRGRGGRGGGRGVRGRGRGWWRGGSHPFDQHEGQQPIQLRGGGGVGGGNIPTGPVRMTGGGGPLRGGRASYM